ncbi:MAG: Gfo/Idh/MocA family protein, partial [Bellilinea sp.]
MTKTVKVGMIGAGFVSDIHAHAFNQYVHNAEIVAVASPNRAGEFAKAHGIPNAFNDYREMLKMKEIDVVTVAIPNYLHCQATLDAAAAGKHIICEKPLCKTLEEADQMIEATRKAGVLLMYAEELCFAP